MPLDQAASCGIMPQGAVTATLHPARHRSGENFGPTVLATLPGTVAILAQGTSWAVAVTQAFWPRFKSYWPRTLRSHFSFNLDSTWREWSATKFALKVSWKLSVCCYLEPGVVRPRQGVNFLVDIATSNFSVTSATIRSRHSLKKEKLNFHQVRWSISLLPVRQ